MILLNSTDVECYWILLYSFVVFIYRLDWNKIHATNLLLWIEFEKLCWMRLKTEMNIWTLNERTIEKNHIRTNWHWTVECLVNTHLTGWIFRTYFLETFAIFWFEWLVSWLYLVFILAYGSNTTHTAHTQLYEYHYIFFLWRATSIHIHQF